MLIPLDVLIPTALVIIILIVLAWVLYSKNKELHGKLISERKKFSFYINETKTLQTSNQTPQKDFERLNQLTRSFFKEYFNLDYSLTYLELREYFEKQSRQDYARYCNMMSDIDYSGKKSKKEEIQRLVGIFYNLVKNYR